MIEIFLKRYRWQGKSSHIWAFVQACFVFGGYVLGDTLLHFLLIISSRIAAFCIRCFFVVRECLVHYRIFSTIPGLTF